MPYIGKANLSHGCIGLGPDGAKWVFDNMTTGDVVQVVNTDGRLRGLRRRLRGLEHPLGASTRTEPGRRGLAMGEMQLGDAGWTRR